MNGFRGAALLGVALAMACAAPSPETPRLLPPVSELPAWSQQGGDAARTSRSPERPPEAWRAERMLGLGDTGVYYPDEYATPIAVEGVAYVGHSGRSFDAVRLADGEFLWRREVSGRVYGTAAWADGLLIFGDDSGVVRALDRNGAEAWTFETEYPVVASPLVAGSRVFVAVADQNVFCLEALTGRPLWQYGRRFPRRNSLWRGLGLCAGEKTVFAGFADGTLVALDQELGRVLWRAELGPGDLFGDVAAGPTYHDGRIYAGVQTGPTVCLDAADGSELWRNPIGTLVGFAVGEERVFAGSAAGSVVALSTVDGSLVWETALEGGAPTPPLLMDGKLVVGTSEGPLALLEAADGRVRARYRPGPGLHAQPLPRAEALLFLSDGGFLHWIR